MIYEEHIQPGINIVPLSLDAAKELFQKLELASNPAETEEISALLKEVVKASGFEKNHHKLWDFFKKYTRDNLPKAVSNKLVSWFHDAFTGYYPANPNMMWASIINKYANSPDGWPDVGQSEAEQKQIDDFSELFLNEWDRVGFNELTDEIEERFELTDWDREIHMKYQHMYFDEDAGASPFLFLSGVNEGQALRRAIKKFDFSSKPDFPHEVMRKIGEYWLKESHVTWRAPHPLGTLLDIV